MERPLGVTVIAVLLAVYGIIAVIGATMALITGVDVIAGLIGLLFGLALLYLAWGLWTLRQWAWLGTLIIMGLNAVFALFAIIAAPEMIGAWISLIISAVVIVYLLREEVRAAFGREARV